MVSPVVTPIVRLSAHLNMDQRAEKFCFPSQLSHQQYISSSLQHNLRPFEGLCFRFQHVSIDVYCNLKAGRDLARLCILAPLAASDTRRFASKARFNQTLSSETQCTISRWERITPHRMNTQSCDAELFKYLPQEVELLSSSKPASSALCISLS